MKSNKILQLITFVLMILFAGGKLQAAPVAEDKAVAWANQTGYKLIETLGNNDSETKYQVLDNMFDQNVDLVYVAKFVLGKYWKNLDLVQKETYNRLFRRYILSLYKSYPLDFNPENINFKINSARITGNYTNVFSSINVPEKFASENLQNINLEFKLAENEGVIKIVDLKIGESSLLLTYRNRFYAMIKDADEDMDWFLEDLETLTLSNEKNLENRSSSMFETQDTIILEK